MGLVAAGGVCCRRSPAPEMEPKPRMELLHGVKFSTQTPHLLVTKHRIDHPHHHQNAQSNSSSHKMSSCDLRRSDMPVERFCLQKCLLQGNLVARR